LQIYLSGREEIIESVVNQITELASIFDWYTATRNGLCRNYQKPQAMAISRNTSLFLPAVKVWSSINSYSTKVKNLGMNMNCNLTWE
jgi:hypothetical protein